MESRTYLKKLTTWLMTAMMVVFLLPAGTNFAYAAGADLPTPEHSKTLTDNGDGTYTLSLSVTGSASTETETTKANVIFIMDRSGSTLTYSTVTTTTDSHGHSTTVKSDPQTITIDNPDPVALRSADLSLRKKWDDSLDPSQYQEIIEKGGKVTLDLYKDSEEYVGDIELSADDEWVIENFVSVASGLMVSEGSPAYDESKYTVVTLDNKKYCVLGEGHDFHFAEHDINSHFELTAYTYHPMLIDGVLTNVTIERDASGNITSITKGEQITEVSATNTIKGGINLTKVVKDEAGNVVSDCKDPFTYKATLKDAEGNPYEYDYRVYYGPNNPNYVEGGENRSEHIYGTGTINQVLYVGDTIRVVNVSAGTVYTVEEEETTGYTLSDELHQISRGSADNYVNYKDEEKVHFDGDDKTYYPVEGNSASRTELTNTYKSGELDITKTVTTEDADKLATAQEATFKFQVDLYADNTKAKELTSSSYEYVVWENGAATSTKGTVSSGGTIELKHGQTAKITGLPDGAFYEVTEDAADPKGYEATPQSTTGTIDSEEVKNAAFANEYLTQEAYTGITLDLKKIDKDSELQEPALLNGAVFTVTKPNGTTATYTAEAGTVTIDCFTEPGTYTMVETKAPDGYSLIDGSWTIKVDKGSVTNISYKGDPDNFWEWLYGLVFSETPSEYQNGVLVIEDPTKTDKKVSVTKSWNDTDFVGKSGYSRPASVEVTISGKGANQDITIPNATQTLNAGNNWTYEWENLPVKRDGQDIVYTVTEKPLDNYTTRITGNDTNGFTVINTPMTDTLDTNTEAVLTKTVTADGVEWASKTFEFTIESKEPGKAPLPEDTTGTATFKEAGTQTIDFGTITFTEPGTYEYTVKETTTAEAGKPDGWTYDNEPKTVTILVTRDEATGGLSAAVTQAAEIENKYEPTGEDDTSTEAGAVLKKTVTADGTEWAPKTFEFSIEGVDGAPLAKDDEGNDITTGSPVYRLR